MRVHKVDWGPGYRFFKCAQEGEYGCGKEFKERSRDCQSPSLSTCPGCNEVCFPHSYEKHYEWETDRFGNLIEG